MHIIIILRRQKGKKSVRFIGRCNQYLRLEEKNIIDDANSYIIRYMCMNNRTVKIFMVT